jgi:serine/threonine protein kinase
MGQVWQATDTQLNRQVALKILPDVFTSDPDRLARFGRNLPVCRVLQEQVEELPDHVREPPLSVLSRR